MYTVYCHVFPNGKRYVGLTSTSLNRRWGNGNGYKSCPLVHRAIEKYGWDNIGHEVLEHGLTLEHAKGREEHYISTFNSNDPEHGYNILKGGDVSEGVPLELRHKLGNGMRGKKHSDETKARISASLSGQRIGEKHPMYGKQMSETTRSKMSRSHKDRWDDEELRFRQSEVQKTVWSNLEYRNKMSKLRTGKVSGNKGKHLSDEAKRKIGEANTGKWIGRKSPCAKPVLQQQKDGIFIRRWDCASDVQRVMGIERSNIAACCRGKVKSAGGYKWEYE